MACSSESESARAAASLNLYCVERLTDARSFTYSAAFCCGTVLAISAVEDGISESPKQDSERRTQARKDLRTTVNALKEMGATWTTAHTSAAVLEGESFLSRASGGGRS